MRAPTGGTSAASSMGRLVAGLLRPYRGSVAAILFATAIETAMSLAAPWPLKIVLDNVIGALASYVDSYYTESVGQWVANDLRVRVYDHLEHFSLAYYDTHQTGTLLSTITDDIATIQGFASSTTLSILVDLLTIVGMLGLMFWLNWDFALVAVGVAPFLLFFVARFRKAVKKAQHQVRLHQADIVTVVQE